MTFKQAVQNGINKIRKPHWAQKDAHLKLHLTQDEKGEWFYGPWGELYEEETQKAIGVETPQVISMLGQADDSDDWEEYKP